MTKFYAHVRNSRGGFMRVTTYAMSAYEATEYFKSVYGAQMITETAYHCPPNEQ